MRTFRSCRADIGWFTVHRRAARVERGLDARLVRVDDGGIGGDLRARRRRVSFGWQRTVGAAHQPVGRLEGGAELILGGQPRLRRELGDRQIQQRLGERRAEWLRQRCLEQRIRQRFSFFLHQQLVGQLLE